MKIIVTKDGDRIVADKIRSYRVRESGMSKLFVIDANYGELDYCILTSVKYLSNTDPCEWTTEIVSKNQAREIAELLVKEIDILFIKDNEVFVNLKDFTQHFINATLRPEDYE